MTQRSDALLVALQDAGFDFVVVGGVAAIAHGASHSTKALDVAAAFTQENLERLLAALRPRGARHFARPDLGPIAQAAAELAAFRTLLLQTDLGRLDVLRDVPPVGGVDELRCVERELLPGRRFRVISLDQLIEVKASLTRPQDKDVERDLRAIRALLQSEGDGRS